MPGCCRQTPVTRTPEVPTWRPPSENRHEARLDTGLNLDFERGALLFAGLIAGVAVLHRLKALPGAVLFCAAYILTRPLGATLGDTLTKPHDQGGFAFGRILATGVIGAAMVALVLLSPRLRRPADA